MNELELKSFYIATCKSCLLADTMKTCRACRFRLGLTERREPIELRTRLVQVPLTVPSLAFQQTTIR